MNIFIIIIISLEYKFGLSLTNKLINTFEVTLLMRLLVQKNF